MQPLGTPALTALSQEGFVGCQVPPNAAHFGDFPSSASVCILEQILLLFTTHAPAYLNVAVLTKHSLCTSCTSWIQQLGLRLLSPLMGQRQFKTTSHKQTCLHTIINSCVDFSTPLNQNPTKTKPNQTLWKGF